MMHRLVTAWATAWATTGAALAAVLALAAPAAAAGGGDEAGTGQLLYAALNFALLVAAIVYFARKPIQDFFSERRQSVRDELDSASELLRGAELRFADWQRRLVDLDQELEGIRAASGRRADDERRRIVADAEAAAQRIRADAHAAVEQELRRARAGLRQEASALAVELAAQRLSTQVNDADRDRLLDEFIDRIAAPGPNGPGPGAGE